MKKFYVYVKRSSVYEVEAKNKDAAIDVVLAGDAVEIDQETYDVEAQEVGAEDERN